MINRDSFVKIMDSLQDYWNKLGELQDLLDISIERNFMTDVFDNIMDALSDDVEDEENDELGPWLYHFAFEMDWGQGDNVIETPEGDRYIEDAGDLYDYLLEVKSHA